MKLNEPERLPPVGCWLIIEVDGQLIRAIRMSHIQTRERDMAYRTEEGETLIGRYRWTYP